MIFFDPEYDAYVAAHHEATDHTKLAIKRCERALIDGLTRQAIHDLFVVEEKMPEEEFHLVYWAAVALSLGRVDGGCV